MFWTLALQIPLPMQVGAVPKDTVVLNVLPKDCKLKATIKVDKNRHFLIMWIVLDLVTNTYRNETNLMI